MMALWLSGCGTPAETAAEGASSDDTTGETETSGPSAEVTYNEHLRPLLEQHCVQCHQPGSIGPLSMTTFEEVHAWRESITLAIEDGIMPPWQASSNCQDYVGDPSLSADEIALVRTWLDEGAQEGDPASYVPPHLPPPPGLSRVDLTLTLPEPICRRRSPMTIAASCSTGPMPTPPMSRVFRSRRIRPKWCTT